LRKGLSKPDPAFKDAIPLWKQKENLKKVLDEAKKQTEKDLRECRIKETEKLEKLKAIEDYNQRELDKERRDHERTLKKIQDLRKKLKKVRDELEAQKNQTVTIVGDFLAERAPSVKAALEDLLAKQGTNQTAENSKASNSIGTEEDVSTKKKEGDASKEPVLFSGGPKSSASAIANAIASQKPVVVFPPKAKKNKTSDK
jgi:hypothetical protein